MGIVLSRQDLILKGDALGIAQSVFFNASGFLRIKPSDDYLETGRYNPLDDTRVHPDAYLKEDFVEKICKDTLTDEDTNEVRGASTLEQIQIVMDEGKEEIQRLFLEAKDNFYAYKQSLDDFKPWEWNPLAYEGDGIWRDNVEQLDLDAYANMLQDQHGPVRRTLGMIVAELRWPFQDPRPISLPLAPKSPDVEQTDELVSERRERALRGGVGG
jgi:transcriptional accessory protein Tex/SPT6